MPEENQIQPWFQSEIQANPQNQQNNLTENQQINQGIVQQNNIGPAKQNLSQSSKPRSSRLTKIVGCIFLLLWIGLIWLWIYWIFENQSDWHYSDYTIRDIIMDSWIFILGPLWILFIVIWILSYRTPNVDIYYHPTRLTKILSGIYRFLWIALVRAGLWNFSLIWTENLSLLKILYVWWIITLCGILYILLWRLLYNTKNKFHLWFSMLYACIINIMFARILREFTDNNRFLIDSDTLESFWTILVLFTLIYFSILTIRWIIKCRKFNKKWVINPKYLNQTPSKKKVWIITTIVLFSLVIINLIYGKIQWSKIPEIDESIFAREEHQTKLPDEEDALIQLKLFQEKIYWPDNDKIMENLEKISLLLTSYNENEKIEWKYHPEECIVVYSWWNEYCSTWAWNEYTLNRRLNSYFITSQKENYITNEKVNEYLSIDWKKVSILEYMDTYEPEIRKKFQELDRILSMDYYLPDDEVLDLIPQFLQWWTRSSISAIRYYIYKWDWNMVRFIIQMNYKIADILNNIWSVIWQLISLVIQWITDSSINTQIQLFSTDFREELSHRYSTQINDKNEIIDKTIKWEYVIWNWAKNGNIMWEVWKDTPSLFQFLFHFPFYSEKEINNMMNYSYYEDWNYLKDKDKELVLDENFSKPSSLYNLFWMYPFYSLKPRFQSINDRMDRALYHKDALIKNLESGKYDVRFNKPDWKSNPYEYESYRLPTDDELFENKIKEYSDITNPCFWKDIMDEPFFDFWDFWDICSQTLSELKEQEKDNFWLREILIEISQLWIDYDKIGAKVNNCFSKKWDICESIFYEQYEILEKMEKAYIKFSDILENIKNKSLEINIDEYFYIPEMMVYDERDELNLLKTDDIELQESIDKIDENNKEVLSWNKSDEQLTYEKLVNLTNECMWEDIIRSHVDLSYDDFINQCNYVMWELKKMDNDWDFKQLNRILTYITKEWIEHANIWKEEDLLFEKEWTDVGWWTPEWDVLFNREDKNLENFKKYYPKLEEIMKKIVQEYEFTSEVNFYIPYSVINENTFRFTLHL